MTTRHCTKCDKRLPRAAKSEMCKHCSLGRERLWTTIGSTALSVVVVAAVAVFNSQRSGRN